jgi:hypothetical protein
VAPFRLLRASSAILRALHQFKEDFLWPFNFAGKNKTYLGLDVKFPIFLSDFNQILNFSTDFYKSSKIKFHINPSSSSRTYMWTSGQSKEETDGQPETISTEESAFYADIF